MNNSMFHPANFVAQRLQYEKIALRLKDSYKLMSALPANVLFSEDTYVAAASPAAPAPIIAIRSILKPTLRFVATLPMVKAITGY